MEATFACGSYARAGAFVARIAVLADAQDHHPDVDLRYPGSVHVVTSSHDVNAITERDVALARAISALRDEHEPTATPEPRARATRVVSALEIAIDALDIDSVRSFWLAVLDYVEKPPMIAGDTVRAIRDPRRVGPTLWFQQMDAPRPGRNRIHLDVAVAHDAAESRRAAVLAVGGSIVSEAHAPSFWVLADPEGNEACICTWQDAPG